MSSDAFKLTAAGWTLAIGASSSPQAADAGDFHAIYGGEAFGNSRRGIVAAVARGIGTGRAALEAAQLAVHSFVEGYYGAPATLGVGRAASLALRGLNAWMFSQSRIDPDRVAMTACLSALVFVGRQVRVIHIGDCRVYRKRGDHVVRLTSEHLQMQPDRTMAPSRALGGDAEIHADYQDDDGEVADRYIILSRRGQTGAPEAGLIDVLKADHPPEIVASTVTGTAPAPGSPAQAATCIAIDVLERPEANFDEMASAFSQLPLREPPQEGDNWDGFVIGRTLYRSRYTTLKLAQDTTADRDVVLKIPFPSIVQDEVFRAGFLREAWVGATVKSPWIARYIDIPPERQSALYLVLPYYHGESLEQRVLRRPAMPYLEGIGIALKICAAVTDLAAFQVIHRDLKPDNVILLGTGALRLLDLGLAYLPGIDEPDDDRLGGTTRYMAPELFRGQPADHRSEVFSLGVMVYRMFAGGAFPFGQRESVPLSRLRPDLPAWLGRCLLRALSTDRHERFQDAAEFAAVLEDGLRRADGPVPVAPAWRGLLRSLPLWRGLALVFAAGLLILLTLLLRGR